MKVAFGRTLQLEKFEPVEFTIEIADYDLPREEGESASVYANRLYVQAYKHILAFEIIHGRYTPRQAEVELKRIRGLLFADTE